MDLQQSTRPASVQSSPHSWGASWFSWFPCALRKCTSTRQVDVRRAIPTRSHSTRLPVELWIYIIDLLEDDVAALRALQLTCWDLLQFMCRDRYLVCDSRSCARLKLLVEFGMAQCIRSLTIRATSKSDTRSRWLNHTLLEVLKNLPAVVTVGLECVMDEPTYPRGHIRLDTVRAILLSFPAMETLQIEELGLRSGFPILVHLTWTLRPTVAPQRHPRWYSPFDTPIQLRDFKFKTCYPNRWGSSEEFARFYLLRWPFKFDLQSLEWNSNYGGQESQMVLAYLLRRSNALKHLHIGFPTCDTLRSGEDTDASSSPRTLNSSGFTHLVSLHLQYRFGSKRSPGAMRAWMPLILSRVNSKNLQELKIILGEESHYMSIDISRLLDWGAFDLQLARLCTVSPRLVTLFHVKPPCTKSKLVPLVTQSTDMIRTRLPHSRAAGAKVGLMYLEFVSEYYVSEDPIQTQWLL
ncbi:hypothetical protein BKA93DRAFT_880178 [Sparassis latifolia]